MANLTPLNFPKRVPPWIVDLLVDWSTLDMREASPRSEEMLVLVRLLAALEKDRHDEWKAIHGHFRPWVGGDHGSTAFGLFSAVERLAGDIDAELGDW